MIRLLRRLRCALSGSHLTVTVWPDDGSPPVTRCWLCEQTWPLARMVRAGQKRADLILGVIALVAWLYVLFVLWPAAAA